MSEAPAEVTEAPADAATAEAAEPKDYAAEAEKWKALARKHEARAKENSAAAAELESLRQSAMSEQEKAVAEAEKRGRQAALREAAENLAAAKIEAALSGIVSEPGAIIEDLNLARYVTDDGTVNTEAVAALRQKYEGLLPRQVADLKQGARPAPPKEQDGNAWFNQLVRSARQT